jgi:acetyl esterase/lipase
MARSDRWGGSLVSAPFAFLLFACLAAACSAAAPQVSLLSLEDRGEGPLGDHYRIVSDEAYGPHDRQRMDLYLSRDVERLGSRDFTIVFLHGGGFSFGDKADNQRYIQPFLQKGLNVVNVNYRIGEGIPLATEDLTLALNHLRRDAGERGLRLDRVVAGGFSAGGQIASTVGFSQGSSDYPFPLDEGIRVVGVLNVSGPVDRLEVVEEVFASSRDEEWKLLVARNLFPPGSPFDRSETLRIFTPRSHLSDDAPAFFLWYGGEDDQVPPATFERFLEEIARSRVEHRIMFEPQAGHSPTNAQLQEAFVEVFQFLDRIR